VTRVVQIAYSCRVGTRLLAGVSKGKRGWDFLLLVTYSDLLDNKKDVSLSKVFSHCSFW